MTKVFELLGIVLVGMFDGVIVGTMGASGGILIVPLLNLVGVPIKAAIGTSLAVDVMGSSVVAYTYNQYKNVDFRQGLWLIVGVVVGAQIGSAVGSTLPSLGLETLYSILLFIGGIFFWRIKGQINSLVSYKGFTIRSSKMQVVVNTLIGLVLGCVSVLFGGGGGVLIFMALVFVFGFTVQKAVGTSALVQVVNALSGAIGYAIRDHVNIFYALIAMIGVIIGGRFTAKYANRIKIEFMSKIIGIIFVILAVIMISLRFL